MSEGVLLDLNVLGCAADRQNLHHIVQSVWHKSNDQQTVKQIHGDSVRGTHLNASDLTDTAIRCENHDGGQVAFEGSVQVGEALNVEHVNLIDEEDAWHKFSNTVINVFVDDFVDFKTELLSDLGLFRSVDLAHEGQEVTTTLGLCVCNIQVVESDVLNDFLLLVHITLGNGNVLFSLEVELSSVRVAAAYALHGT